MKKVRIHLLCIALLVLTVVLPVKAETSLKDVVYTSMSGKGSLETGTRENPYSSFEDAVANVAEGGTIYVMGGDTSEYGYINAQSDEDAPFVIDKEVTIEPEPGVTQASISCRAAGIMLGADVTFKKIELDFANSYHDHIYANGYHLTLDNVTRYQGARLIDLVAGGLYDASTGTTVGVTSGTGAAITIIGKNSEFGNLYAGGMNGGYTGDVTIELKNVNSTSINAIYGCGATEPYVDRDNFFDFGEPDYPAASPSQYPVTGTVDIGLEDATILTIDGAGATGGTNVSYTTTYLKTGQTLDNISKLTVVKGSVQPKVLTAPEGQYMDVTIAANGTLDLSGYTSFSIGDFTGGGKLVVAQDSLTTIHESATGNTVFETSNQVMRQGDYIIMPAGATATFSYTPVYDQKGWKLQCEETESGKSWSAVMVDTIYISYWSASENGEVSIEYEILLPDEKADGSTALPKEGYHFVKWVKSIDSETMEEISTEATFVPTWGEDYELVYYYDAYFAPNTYRVQFEANGGTGVIGEQQFTYDTAQTLTKCAFSREGYEFTGWNTNADGTGTNYSDQQEVKNLTSEQEGTMLLYAQWKNVNAGDDNSGGDKGNDTEDNPGGDKGNDTDDNSGGDKGNDTEGNPGGDAGKNESFNQSKLDGVKVSKVTYHTVTLNWNARSGATGYEIYRSVKKSSGYKKVATVKGTSYTDKNRKTGQRYYYKVRAVSGEQQSELSDVVVGKPVLAKPVVKVTKGKKSATIRYGKVKGANGYEIYRSTKKNKGFKKIATTKKTRYKNGKLTSKKTYYYKVRAYRKVDGKKVYSSFSQVKVVKVR